MKKNKVIIFLLILNIIAVSSLLICKIISDKNSITLEEYHKFHYDQLESVFSNEEMVKALDNDRREYGRSYFLSSLYAYFTSIKELQNLTNEESMHLDALYYCAFRGDIGEDRGAFLEIIQLLEADKERAYEKIDELYNKAPAEGSQEIFTPLNQN